jgi:hypothetical protein
MTMNKLRLLGLAMVAGVSVACTSTPEAPAMQVAIAETPAPVPSADPRVKFKDGERYLRDLSASLGIPRDDICKELSRYDCMTDAFRIVLGGVEAPNLLVNEPIDTAALTSPIAVDRVALHVCANRVRRDRETPASAVLFKAGAYGRDGRDKSPSQAWLSTTADAIYGSILLRSPSEREVATLAGFYNQVAGGRPASSQDVAADWVTLSCFAVASSLEAVFY